MRERCLTLFEPIPSLKKLAAVIHYDRRFSRSMPPGHLLPFSHAVRNDSTKAALEPWNKKDYHPDNV